MNSPPNWDTGEGGYGPTGWDAFWVFTWWFVADEIGKWF